MTKPRRLTQTMREILAVMPDDPPIDWGEIYERLGRAANGSVLYAMEKRGLIQRVGDRWRKSQLQDDPR